LDNVNILLEMSNKIGQAHNQQLQYFRQHKYKMKLPCLLSEIYEIENASQGQTQNMAVQQQPPLVQQQSHLLVQHQTSITNTPPTPPPSSSSSISQHMTPSPHSHHHYHPHTTHLNPTQQYHIHNQSHNSHIIVATASNTPPSRNPQQTQLIQVAASNGQQYMTAAPQAAFIKADDSFNVAFIKQQSQYQPQQQQPQNKNMSGFIRFASSIN